MTEIFKCELYKNEYFPKEITKIILNFVYVEYNKSEQEKFTLLLEKYIKTYDKLSLLTRDHDDKSLINQHFGGIGLFFLENNGIVINNPIILRVIKSLKNWIHKNNEKELFIYPFLLYKEFDDCNG